MGDGVAVLIQDIPSSAIAEAAERARSGDVESEGPSPDTAGFASLAEAAAAEPAGGAYLVARTYRSGRVLELDAHFDRLERSAGALDIPERVPRRELRWIVASMRRRLVGDGDVRFRISLLPSNPARSGSAPSEPWYRISVEPARELPVEYRRSGVVCGTAPGAGRSAATVKDTTWIARRREIARPDAYETLLLTADGRILEGTSSNFYAVRGDRLETAGDGVLAGIARRIVLTVAASLAPDLETVFTAPRLDDLAGNGVEAFISSATRGIVPVRMIDDRSLPAPGNWTRRLMAGYEAWLDGHLVPLVDADS